MAEEAVLHGIETTVAPGMTEAGERVYVASQWQLMWWRFRKHHLAMAAGIVVVCFYLVAMFADFLATTDPELSDARRSLMPPQRIYWFDGWSLRPRMSMPSKAPAIPKRSSASTRPTRRKKFPCRSSPVVFRTNSCG